MVGIESGQPKEYPAAELLEEFERVWTDAGKRPTTRTLHRLSRISVNAFRNKWGTVKRLGDLVARYRRGEISRAAVLKAAGKAKRRKEVPLGVRWRVIERDGYRCVACGRSPATERGVELHVDHVRAVARGGGNEIANLRTLCSACNMGRGTGGTGVRARAA
ncbi:MAG: HNH endonuclease [Phycisphaerales bacterium]|nr:HNH endonuclease [Phycisphaerales bacterium]